MNYLARRIGIWYQDRNWAEKVFQELIEHMPSEYIVSVRRRGSEMVANFIDGSLLRMIPTNDASRGQRYTELYVQAGIDINIYEKIIAPSAAPYYKGVVIISKAEDIVHGGSYWN